MPVSKADQSPFQKIKDGISRRHAHTEHLMMAVIDFTDGPWPDAEPLQSHVHEQVTFVSAGEIIFFCEGEAPQHLKEGDIFLVPSNRKHGIQLMTATARLIDTFTPVREDFLAK
jgi:quercetin dioxygenase-like cupin family protein